MTRALLILLSAAMFGAALPPWNLPGVIWVAVVPLFCVLRRLSPGRGALAGLLWGTAAIWAVGYWVPGALARYYEQPLWFGILFAVGASIVFAGTYAAAFGWCACRAMQRTRGVVRALLLAVLWVTFELARARALTGDPWLLTGYALAATPVLAQAADVGGVYALSFLIAFVNASIAELWFAFEGRDRDSVRPTLVLRNAVRLVGPAGLLLLAVYGYGRIRLDMTLTGAAPVTTAVIQANNDMGAQWREEFHGRGLERYLDMSLRAAKQSNPRLLIWPESAVTFFLAREKPYQTLIGQMLQQAHAELIVGAPHYEDADPARPQYFNSAFYLTSEGKLGGRYDKAHLLPFAEYFPLRTIEILRRRFERVRYFTAGDGATLIHTDEGTVAVVICFEGIFPDLVRRQMRLGADLLVNLSNDSWLGAGAGPEQHLSMVTLRAVENRTWVIRATTTGISAVIDPYGRIIARTGFDRPEILTASVVPMQVATIYKRYGDLFAYLCVLASFAALIAVLSPERRRPSAESIRDASAAATAERDAAAAH